MRPISVADGPCLCLPSPVAEGIMLWVVHPSGSTFCLLKFGAIFFFFSAIIELVRELVISNMHNKFVVKLLVKCEKSQ